MHTSRCSVTGRAEVTPLDPDTFRAAVARLTAESRPLARAVDRHGVPEFWHRPSGFATLALFIVEQQVSLASAKAVFERLVNALGGVRPATVLASPPEILGQVGLTRQKQRYLRELAAAVESGHLDLEGLAEVPDAEAHRRLRAIPGIGRWTADVYLLSALRRPDVWPTGDRALQVGVGEVLASEVPTPTELEEIGELWRPFRSVAARLVWHAYLTERNRSETEVAGLTPIPPDGGTGD